MDAITLKANLEARERATEALRALVTEYAGKDMPAEARAKENKILDEISDYDERIKSGVEHLNRSNDINTLTAGLLNGNAAKRDESPDENALLRSIATMGIGEGHVFEERAVDKPNNPNLLTRTLFGQLLKQYKERSTVMFGGATVFNTTDANPIDFTIVTGRATAGIVAENGTIPESEPTTTQRTMGGYKYGYATALSYEFVQDQALDLVGFIVGDSGPAIGDAMGRHFLTGTGTNQPRGVFTDASAATATWSEATGTDEQIADALIDLSHELPRGYRPNARYLVSDQTVRIMRKLRDANGQFLWANGLTAGAPGTFNGYTVLEDDGVADDKVLFADLSKYRIRMAGGLRVERSVDIKFMTDQIVYRFLQRADGLLVDQTAAKVLTVAA